MTVSALTPNEQDQKVRSHDLKRLLDVSGPWRERRAEENKCVGVMRMQRLGTALRAVTQAR